MGQKLLRSGALAAALLLAGTGAGAQNLEWVQSFGNEPIFPWFLEVPEGQTDVYLAGGFLSPADFDPGPGTAILQNSSFEDIFVAKYDSSGQYLWAGVIGGPPEMEFAFELETDSSGNVYLWGSFSGEVDFDPGPGTVLRNSGP
ncbi:MAG: hypothetical protein AAGM22_07990 [Acidobacteriota bacterium]